ncbi:MAG: protein kinase [Deltaproteobacteria bacterium]|nr:MAG: protein kinase [Deltaproteobacteria bacterium]
MNVNRDELDRAIALDKRAIGRLVSLFEDERPAAVAARADAIAALDASGRARSGRFVAITGAPGAGKSTLIGQLAPRMIARDRGIAVAVVAVDPTSPVSGGALLGDRTRVAFDAAEDRLFFRSQASALALGGLGRHTYAVARLLRRLFDLVVIETVGIGQSEVEVRHLADRMYLVLQPLAGDHIQFMKAGIMEVPDAIVLNKADEPAAGATWHALRSAVGLGGSADALFRASATTGDGLDALAADMLAVTARPPRRTPAEVDAYFFERWVVDEFGRRGARRLREEAGGDLARFLADAGGFEAAQVRAARVLDPT